MRGNPGMSINLHTNWFYTNKENNPRKRFFTPEIFKSVCYWLSAINVKPLAQGHMQYCLLCVLYDEQSCVVTGHLHPGCQTAAANGDIASFVLYVCEDAISHE